MADPAYEARWLVNRSTARLAQLRRDLRSQEARVGVARAWLDAAEAPHVHERPPLRQIAPSVPSGRGEVVPPAKDPAIPRAERQLRVVVSEQRQVSLELESRIGTPAPEFERRDRLAS
jgi:hypothetical protein